MPIYFIFLIVAVLIAIYSDKIDKKVSANGKVKKIIIISCISVVATVSVAIKLIL